MARSAGHPLLAAMPPVSGMEMGLAVEIVQAIQLGIDDEDDIAAWAAVTPIRPTARNEFLAAEADHTVATVTAADVYPGLIEEHCSVGKLAG
jgi:hypothetical protein